MRFQSTTTNAQLLEASCYVWNPSSESSQQEHPDPAAGVPPLCLKHGAFERRSFALFSLALATSA